MERTQHSNVEEHSNYYKIGPYIQICLNFLQDPARFDLAFKKYSKLGTMNQLAP
jgi:hypothetical protein